MRTGRNNERKKERNLNNCIYSRRYGLYDIHLAEKMDYMAWDFL